MAWIESHAELRDHPKRKRLSRRLGLDLYQTIGLLNCLWWWVQDYAPDGDLSRFEPADIADGISYPWDPEELVEGLRFAGFLDEWTVHDWDQYGEKLFRRRQHNAAQMRAARAKAKEAANEGEDDTTPARVEHVLNTYPTHVDLEDRQTGQTGQDRQRPRARVREAAAAAPVEKSPAEQAALTRLQSITGYPFDEGLDLELLREPRDPRVKLAAEVFKFRDYWAPTWKTWSKKNPPNYRLAWRNWLERAEEICKKNNGPLPASHVPFEAEEVNQTPEQRAASLAAMREAAERMRSLGAGIARPI